MRERLQKVLAHAGVASRRAAERLILEGRVRVNGKTVTQMGTQVDPGRDAIRVDDKPIPKAPERHLVVMLHKPRGFVTTTHDPQGRPTVRDLLKGVRRRIYPIGRLDFHTEGLLLLTDDGDLARDLMHPRSGVSKTYIAKVRGEPTRASLERMDRGILLDGKRTKPAQSRLLRGGTHSWVEVTVTEGRKHQVRRMLFAIGHPVQRLRRTRYGEIELRGLAPGEWRSLTPPEIERLRRALPKGEGGEKPGEVVRRQRPS